LADAQLYRPYHQAFTAAGYAVLIFDYRGYGRSDGMASVDPHDHVQDWLSALAYARVLPTIDADRVGSFGSGGTGGGNAVMAAAADPEVSVTISQVPIADGSDWLRSMRSSEDWDSFLDRLARDARRRAVTGNGDVVAPRGDIQPLSEARSRTNVKSDVDRRIPDLVPLSSVNGLLDYRPLEAAPHARALMVIAVEDDDVTPTNHALNLYEAALAPKQLLLLRNTTHYAAYDQYRDGVTAAMVAWLGRFLGGEVRPEDPRPAAAAGIHVRSEG
jgi:alpha/beta superfamily hydrolase